MYGGDQWSVMDEIWAKGISNVHVGWWIGSRQQEIETVHGGVLGSTEVPTRAENNFYAESNPSNKAQAEYSTLIVPFPIVAHPSGQKSRTLAASPSYPAMAVARARAC